MNKTIEHNFFRAFLMGGVFHTCIEWMQDEYNLTYSDSKDEMHPTKRHLHDVVEPSNIKLETEAFDSGGVEYLDSLLMDEIECNINECKTEADRMRYICTLLTPFKVYSDIFTPIKFIESSNKDTERCRQHIEFWKKNTDKKMDSNRQIECLNEAIEKNTYNIERSKYISEQLKHLSRQDYDADSVGRYFYAYCHIVIDYANRLDALLLTYGIDLFRVQEECGIYLLEQRDVFVVSLYIGSMELTRKYISNLPIDTMNLPETMDKQLAKIVFSKAIKAGYMKPTKFGCRWDKNNLGDSLLAYMLMRIYPNRLPISELEPYFGVEHLSKTRNQVKDNKGNEKTGRPAGCPLGYEKIDALFEDIEQI